MKDPIHLVPDTELTKELANRDKKRAIKRATKHRLYLHELTLNKIVTITN